MGADSCSNSSHYTLFLSQPKLFSQYFPYELLLVNDFNLINSIQFWKLNKIEESTDIWCDEKNKKMSDTNGIIFSMVGSGKKLWTWNELLIMNEIIIIIRVVFYQFSLFRKWRETGARETCRIKIAPVCYFYRI